MGGIPWWAALIGTPIAAGKMANGVAETVDSLNKVNDMMDARNDRKQYASDLSAFRADPTYVPSISGYKNPETAAKVISTFQKQAAPAQMDQFKAGYEKLTGTSDPRFFGDADSRAELAKNGLTVPTNNPEFNTSLAAFRNEGEQAQSLKAAMENDPWAIAAVARDKDVAAGMKNTAEAAGIPIARQTAADKEARIQQQADFTEQQKRDAAAQQSDFEKMASGIGGRYQDAQPKLFNTGTDGQLQQVPYTAPDGKQTNIWNDGFNYVDNNGDVTPRRVMPYDEARQLMMQAAADYPLANPKEALAALEKQYGKEYTDANYKPSAVNWNGTATTDKNQLQLAAESGDPLAQRIIAAQDAREIAQAKAKAESRHITNNMGGDGLAGFTPEDVKYYADIYRKTGNLPSLGMGASSLRAAILRAASVGARDEGKGAGDQIADIGETKSLQAAMKTNQQRLTAVKTFNNTIETNMQIVRDLKKQYGANYGKLVNQAYNMYQQGIAGSGDLASLQLVLRSTANEIAKLESGSLGNSEVSVEQAKKLNTMFSQNMNDVQLYKLLDNAKTIGSGRVRAVEKEQEGLKAQLAGKGGSSKTVVKKFVSPSTGKTKLVYSDGTEEIR